MSDTSAQRREDIAEQLTVAAGLLDEPGWAGVVEGVLTQAMQRLAELEFDEFQERFEAATDRLYLACGLIEGDFTKATALCLIDNLFVDSFDPLGFSETDDERITRIEAYRRWEAGQ